ncbi:phage tail tape measure protein [Bacteroides fragilis]|nr:phage tail tape measure protein [Bacteroides fragilis]
MRVEVGAQGNVWSRASGFINKYIGLIGTVIAAITGVSMKLNQLREQRNKREEAKADVEALTGLSKDDINWLEQQAVQLSTTMTESGIRIRQSATEILDAYKLVGSAKPELLDNKEALAEVTKQTLILASASGMTLKDAVDAVTLSLNQYGDGADQASCYANAMAAGSKYGAAAVESVTTAVTKSGVAAASAEIPIEQLVGTIETLGEKGIKDEIAGTGLKKFFLTLQTGADDTNPKIVGLEKALDNLQKKQLSAAQIKKQFGEEGYNVASVLINEADKVKYYTEAVTGTSVAMEQAATKSETAAAKLSQAKNRMQELGIELLEKLNPALISAANGAVSWTGKLIKLLNFINENKRAITLLTIALIAYTAAKNSDVIISKVVTFWNNNIAKSLKAIKKELMTNPYGIIAVVAATAIAYLINLKKKNDELKDSVSGIKKVNEETNKSFIQQESKIRALTAVINDNGIALDVRRKALNDLKEIIPDYNAQLTDEGTLTKNNTDAIKDYLVQLEKQIKLKAAQQELENLYAQKRTLEKDEETQSDQYWKIRQTNTLQGYNRNSLTAKISRLFGTEKEGKALETLNETRKNLSSISEKIDEITKEIGESALAIEEVNKANEETTNNKITTPIIDEEKAKALLKKKLEEEAKLYSQHQSELKEAYLKRQDETLQTEQQFNDRMETLELEHQQRIINIAGAKSKEGIDAQNRINDIKIKQQKEQMNRQLAEEKTLYENQQKDLKLLYVSGKNENLKTEKEYNEAMEHLTIMHRNVFSKLLISTLINGAPLNNNYSTLK